MMDADGWQRVKAAKNMARAKGDVGARPTSKIVQGTATGEFNVLCETCAHGCKQWVTSVVVSCPKRTDRRVA